MYIEDLLHLINDNAGIANTFANISLNNLEKKYIFNLSQYCVTHGGLTDIQRKFAIKLLKKNSKLLSTILNTDANLFLKNPEFKLPIVEQKNLATLEEINSEIKIVLNFPYNNEIVRMIQNHRQKYFSLLGTNSPYYEIETKKWYLGLTELNILFLNKLMSSFTIDENLLLLNNRVNEIVKKSFDYIPLISFNTHYYLKNIADSVPQIKTANLAEVLVHAQRYGIHDWDEVVQEHIDNDLSIKELESFFKKRSTVSVNLKVLTPLIPYCKKLLFVLPQTQELQYITKVYEFLKGNGVDLREISVLYKKSNKDMTNFKNYIVDQKFNKKITDQTRFIIITNPVSNFLNVSSQNFDFVLYGGTHRYFSRKHVKNYFDKNFNSAWFNI